jgi:ribosomal protein L40E
MARFVVWIATAVAMGSFLAAAPAPAADAKYVGAQDCGRCHKKDLIGNQLAEWKKDEHAKAMDALKSEKAQKIAKERGLKVAPHEADECVKCHATAHGLEKAQIFKKPLAISDGVQCESCHGPGSEYRKKKVMSDHDKSVAAGMWEPGENQKICTDCHNSDSPTWDAAKGFDFEAMKKKIAHPIPKDVKGHYIELEKKARAKSGASATADDEE